MDARLAWYIARVPARPDRGGVDPLADTAPPNIPFSQELRSTGLTWRFGALVGAHAIETGLVIAGWAFIGSGAVFYFGEEGDTTLRTITADLSGYLPGKLYIRVYAIYKDTVRPQTLKTAVEEHMAAALRSLGLRTGSS